MMNKKQSSLLHVARYAVLVPLIAAPLLLVTACSDEALETASPANTPATATEQNDAQSVSLSVAALHYIDGRETTSEAVEQLDPEKIHSVNVIKGEKSIELFGERALNGVIAVTTKENQNAPEVLQFNKKLPVLPPPPPPVSNVEAYIPDASNQQEDYQTFPKRNPEAVKLIDSEDIVAYIFHPDNFTEDEFAAAQKLFSKYGCRLTFENQYKGRELTQLKLSANDQNGSLVGIYDIQELKSSNEVVILKIDKVNDSIGIASRSISK